MDEVAPMGAAGRVLTVPNVLSLLRLLAVPLLVWLLLGPRADGWALAVLVASGATDWLDGYLARAWNQTSRLGELLDPVADRLAVVATVLAFAWRDIVPLAFALALLGRDFVLAATLPLLRRSGYGPLPVHYLGKAATFNLLLAFPLLLVAQGSSVVAGPARVLGWSLAGWGGGLYLWAGVLYLRQVRQLLRGQGRNAPPPSSGNGPPARGSASAPLGTGRAEKWERSDRVRGPAR